MSQESELVEGMADFASIGVMVMAAEAEGMDLDILEKYISDSIDNGKFKVHFKGPVMMLVRQ